MAATPEPPTQATMKLDPTCLSVGTLVPLSDNIPMDFGLILGWAYRITRSDIALATES